MKSLEKIGFEFLKMFWSNVTFIYRKVINIETLEEKTQYIIRTFIIEDYNDIEISKENFIELINTFVMFIDFDDDYTEWDDLDFIIEVHQKFIKEPQE